ncbi:MAG: exopolysaccharide biosynthesis polyprenyl glycosylphosphotransferase [Clostridia bacterium]|nr:exopolysaccharide biosynthesis polyprenyl glycosylphosphotransferase [Clostridia bacterium]
MNAEKRNIWIAIENIIDFFVNILSIFVGYLFAIMIYDGNVIKISAVPVIIVIAAVLFVASFFYQAFNLYARVPGVKPYRMLFDILKANAVYFGILVILAALFAAGYVKLFIVHWILISAFISTVILMYKKRAIIKAVIEMRKKQENVRTAIIIGDNILTASDYVKAVFKNRESGIKIIGCVGRKMTEEVGCQKLGDFEDLERILDEYKPSEAVFAIDSYDKKHLIKLVNLCDDRCIKVFFLPVIYGFFKNPRQIEQVGSMPVINIHSTPLDNKANAMVKRAVDILGSLALIIITSPIMLVAVIGVKLSSPGPILFKQKRVGMLGKDFYMYKFRSMRVNDESTTAWSTDYDPRKTKFGNFMRKTSIDELPQLFNVLLGSMSLVGPRPEIPHFVEHFKEIIPLYMVKHYVKPGMTGLAQIKGLRGDTSVEDRIHEDIEYIENWSLALDIAILFKTPFKAINMNEKYGSDAQKQPLPNGKKRILYVASTVSHINNFHRDYIAALRNEGNEVSVLARGEGADFDVPFEKKFFSKNNTKARKMIKKIVADGAFDVILLNTTLAAFHVRWALPKKNRPRVVNFVHGYLFSGDVGFPKSTMLLTLERLVSNKTDEVIVMNKQDLRLAERHHLAPSVRFVRGMGVSLREEVHTPEEIREEIGAQDKFLMCFVGELSGRKNQEFLIRCMPKVKEKIENAALVLVGDGDERERLESLVSQLGLSDSVIFAGRRSDALDFMRACDVYVSASKIEGLPFNIVEALGCERPVVACNVKGHSDVLDGVGLLYDGGDEKQFVNCVSTVQRGEFEVQPLALLERYEYYSKEQVFEETLGAVKEAMIL